MADTTPIANQINVDVSRRIDDAVAHTGDDNGQAAARDGIIVSAVLRNQYVNQAARAIATELISRFGAEGAAELADGVTSKFVFTMSSIGVQRPSDFLKAFRLTNAVGTNFVYGNKADWDNDYHPAVKNAYAIEGGRIYVYIRTADVLTLQSSGTATLYYVKAERIVNALTATATATVSGGVITALTVVSPGSDYQSVPAVTITGGGGINGAGTAVLVNGQVVSITITNAGSGYTSAPSVSIAAPGGTAGSFVLVNTVPDITLEQLWHEAVEHYAVGLVWYDKGMNNKDQELVGKGEGYMQLALSKLPGGAQQVPSVQ